MSSPAPSFDPLDLSEDSLLDQARHDTGLEDFGGQRFREGLAVLLETYEGAGLKPGGRKRTRSRLVQLLSTRLKVTRTLERHPEIRQRSIHLPVYLTGLPRTGTSALFNLLAADPAARPLLLWEAMFPDPLEGLTEGTTDPRLEFLRELFEHNRRKNPDFDRIHYVDAEGPEECVLLLAHTFCDVQNGIEPLMSPYREWFEAQDLGPSYDYYADLLRMLDWQRPGQRWLLKSPAHLWALDSIVRLFPDACIIQTHRDPLEIVASYCSMMAAVMSIRESIDATALGRAVLDHLVALVERGMAARRHCDPARFVDVHYEGFVADPLATLERIYERFSLPLDDTTRQALRSYADEHGQAKHGSHAYSLQDYGLSADEVRQRFANYAEYFGLPGY